MKSSSKQAFLSVIVGVATISYFLPVVCHSIFMFGLKIMLLTQLPVDQAPRVLLDQCPRDDCSSKPRRVVYGGLPSFTQRSYSRQRLPHRGILFCLLYRIYYPCHLSSKERGGCLFHSVLGCWWQLQVCSLSSSMCVFFTPRLQSL